MEFTKISPIKYDVKVDPGSTIKCEFMIRGSKKPIKLNVVLHIYYKHPTRINMFNTISSDIQSVYTSKDSTTHKVEIKVPEFENCTQSFININIDNSADVYEKAYLEYINVDTGPLLQHVELPQYVQQPAQQSASLRQSLADQLRASTIVPNTQPKTCQSSQVDIFSQSIMSQSRHATNLQIQDVQPRQREQSSLLNSAPQPIRNNKILEHSDKIVFVSTWNVKCGVALYTEDLYNELNELYPNLFMINPINGGVLKNNINAKLTHLQHEYGIIPNPPPINGKVIITWHTIPYNIADTIKIFESQLDVVAHIVPCIGATSYIRSTKDVYVVSLGSKLMPEIKKEDARIILKIENINIPIGFVFGFQSSNKNYNRLVQAAKNTNIHLIISGSIHDCGYKSNIQNDKNITILERYLTDVEIDLYSLASDILLFDYAEQNHYSSSSALHRTIGSGRPVICADIKHFSNIEGVPKFKNQEELEKSIKYALDNPKPLEMISLEFAKNTSRENIAKRHIDIYKKYVNM